MISMKRRTFIKTGAVLGSSLVIGVGLSGCGSHDSPPASMRFAVLSDPHVYDTTLGSSGAAFEAYLQEDRKMLVESAEILETIVDKLLQEKELDALIIPGDMTKDGELLCHQKAIEILQPLRDAGIQVFVVPGNHDINNPEAVAFDGDSTTTVENVTADDFAALYADFGYNAAHYRHENSLSYIVEPVPGVWLVALDSCKYEDNLSLGKPDTSGRLSDELLSWLHPLLEEARQQDKVVFGMLHHGIVPHFASQPSFFAEYLVDDYESVGQELAESGLHLLFSGHFHAQDAVAADYNGDGSMMLYDVETGSTVTSPCSYRLVDLDMGSGIFNISSASIDTIPSRDDFASYKESFINNGMQNLYRSYLAAMGLQGDALTSFATLAASLHVAHFKGDEATDASTLATLQALAASDDPSTASLGRALYSLAVDPGLADNNLSLSLQRPAIAMTGLLQRLLNRAVA